MKYGRSKVGLKVSKRATSTKPCPRTKQETHTVECSEGCGAELTVSGYVVGATCASCLQIGLEKYND